LKPRAYYDVIVLGAGPAGSTAAFTLARRSLSVLVVEPQVSTSFKVGESVPGVIGAVLTRAGFPHILRRVPQLKCSGNRSSWGSADLHVRPAMLDPYGGGAHLDRSHFDRELLRESIAAGAQVWHDMRFDHATRSNIWTVFLRSGAKLHAIECNAVIDCTGRNAYFARKLGVTRIVLDKQVAVASVFLEEGLMDDDLTTTIEAAREGWWYTARIPERRRVVVFFTDGSLLRGLHMRTSQGFVEFVRQSKYIREFLNRSYRVLGHPVAFQAETSYLTCSAGDAWCAAGDSAAALDPLASAGIVNAVNGGFAAARLVLGGFNNVDDYTRATVEQAKTDAETRRAYYLMEGRWPTAPFWASRHRRLEVTT
jgi:flavin-dependent dehydrogenase